MHEVKRCRQPPVPPGHRRSCLARRKATGGSGPTQAGSVTGQISSPANPSTGPCAPWPRPWADRGRQQSIYPPDDRSMTWHGSWTSTTQDRPIRRAADRALPQPDGKCIACSKGRTRKRSAGTTRRWASLRGRAPSGQPDLTSVRRAVPPATGIAATGRSDSASADRQVRRAPDRESRVVVVRGEPDERVDVRSSVPSGLSPGSVVETLIPARPSFLAACSAGRPWIWR
jgi:hypothetical protein